MNIDPMAPDGGWRARLRALTAAIGRLRTVLSPVQLPVLPVLGPRDIEMGHQALVGELVNGQAVGEARLGGRTLRSERRRGCRVGVPASVDEVPERLQILEQEDQAVRLAA